MSSFGDSGRSVPGKCLVIGASCRSLAQSLVLAGWSVHAIDLFADRDLEAVAEVRQIERLDDWLAISQSIRSFFGSETPDLIFLTGGMENQAQVLEKLEAIAPLAGPPVHHVLAMRRWFELRKLAVASGIHLPESWFLPSAKILPRSMVASGVWLSKSSKSSGGLGVQHRTQTCDARLVEGIVQRRIEGYGLGVTFLSDSTCCRPIAAMESWRSPSDQCFLYQGSIGPVVLPKSIQESLERFAEAIVGRWSFRGWIQADFIVDHSDSLWLLEINPRWSSSMELIEKAWSLPLSRLIARPFQETFEALPSINRPPVLFAGKRILYADRDREVSAELSDRMMEMRFDPSALDRAGRWVADIPQAGTIIQKGHPMCTVIVADNSIEAVRNGLVEVDFLA